MTDQWRTEECLKRLEECDVYGYDTEGSGLDWQRNFNCGYVFTFGALDEDTYYLPVRHKGGGNIPGCRIPKNEFDYTPADIHPVERRIAAILAAKPRTMYAHNAKFDLHASANHGIWPYGDIEDTKVAAALLDENQGRYDLDRCCHAMEVRPKVTEIYAHIADYLLRTEGLKVPPTQRGTMGHFWKLPAHGKAAEYAMGDGISMHDLRIKQLEKIEEEELGLVWAVEKRVTRVLFRMERRGVPVDVEMLDRVCVQVKDELDKAQKELPPGLNVRSPPQMYRYFLEKGVKEEEFQRTATGAASITEEWLDTRPEGAAVLAVRKLRNLEATFLNNAIRNHLYRGRVHCNYNQIKTDDYGTVSGRLSSDDPNMQQVPKRDKKLAPMIRQLFRSATRLWWTADYSQQEYRVFAEYAQAKYVLQVYADNPSADYHQMVADLLGVDRDPTAKRINLGVIYRMGAPKLAIKLGVPLSVARGYMLKLKRQMPEAETFNKTAENVAKQRGFVRTLLKRRRRFPGGAHAHKAGNAVIQGSSADITKLKMAEIDEFLMGDPMQLDPAKSLYKSELILQVHDSLDFLTVPEEEPIMLECMRMMESFGPDDLIQLSVPMKVDYGVNKSWGHATFPKFDKFLDVAA